MTAIEMRAPEAWNPEHALVGALLEGDPAAIAAAAEEVSASDFSDERPRAVFEAILALDSGGRLVSLVTVAEVLKSMGKLALAGGPGFLGALPDAQGCGAVVEYARMVRERGARRHLRRVCAELTDLCLEPTVELSALLDTAGNRFGQVLLQRQRAAFKSMGELVEDTLAALDPNSGNSQAGLETGFGSLDEVLAPMQPGELIILAARPSVGKTALAMQVAEYQACEKGLPVGVFSLEMPARQLVLRMASGRSGISLARLRSGALEHDEEEALAEAMEQLHSAPIHIDDSPDVSPIDLRAKARRLKQRNPDLALLVIDYIQLMRPRSRAETRQVEVAEISRSLKLLAKELEVPILGLSQLSRRAEDRPGPPLLSDLRESGSIEQDADAVLLLHRLKEPGGQTRPAEDSLLEVRLGKQRNGPLGSARLRFRGATTRFIEHLAQR